MIQPPLQKLIGPQLRMSLLSIADFRNRQLIQVLQLRPTIGIFRQQWSQSWVKFDRIPGPFPIVVVVDVTVKFVKEFLRRQRTFRLV